MALVMKTDMVANHLANNMIVTDGVITNIVIDNVTHMDIVNYPIQGEFTEGAVLGLLQKPFIDFAMNCGAAGDMTAEMITTKYADVPTNLANAIAADFAKAYSNYVVIPDGMTLMITGDPIPSVFTLMLPEEPLDEPERF